LATLKRKYDPANFFRLNHNITPFPEQAGPDAPKGAVHGTSP